MKESSGKTKKLSKGVRRARSMRNVVMMVLVCVLMLSAATYAWFSLSTAAKVAGLSMTVGEETSLLIAPDLTRNDTNGTPGLYGNALNFGMAVKDASGNTSNNDGEYDFYKIDCALLPSTLTADGKVYSPEYDSDDGTVITGFAEVTETTNGILKDSTFANNASSTSGRYYVYRTKFYLSTAGSKSVTVRLKSPGANSMSATTAPTSSGTYIINNGNTKGAAALRIKLSATNTTTNTVESIVYAPLNNILISEYTDAATIKDGIIPYESVTVTDEQSDTGEFTKNNGKITVSPQGTRVTMEVWIEGSDDQCVNQIMGSNIQGVLAFEVVEDSQNP